MASIQFSGNSINTYENLKHMYSGVDLAQSFVKGQSTTTSKLWADYASNNMLDSLISIYTDRDKLGGNSAFESLYDNYDYMTADQRIAAAATELYADRNTLNTYTRYKTDDEGKYIEKSDGTYETEEYEDTEYNYYRDNLLKQAAQAKADYEAEVSKDTKADINGFWQFCSTIFSVGTLHTLYGMWNSIENLGQLISSPIVAGIQSGTSDKSFDEAWRSYMSVNLGEDLLTEFDAKYTWLADGEGNYNSAGSFFTSVFESIGMALPSMIAGIGIGKLASSTSSTAITASKILYKANGASYWVSMGVNTLKDYLNDPALNDVSTLGIIGIAATTTTLEALITHGMNIVFGGTFIDNLIYGTSSTTAQVVKNLSKNATRTTGLQAVGQVVLGIVRDGAKEGLEEVLQEYSTAYINWIASKINSNFESYSQFTIQQLFTAFGAGMLSTIVTGAVGAITNVNGVNSNEVKTNKDGSIKIDKEGNPVYYKYNWAQSLKIRESIETVVKTINDVQKNKNIDTATKNTLIADLTNVMAAVGNFYNANKDMMDGVMEILDDMSKSFDENNQTTVTKTYTTKNVPHDVVTDFNDVKNRYKNNADNITMTAQWNARHTKLISTSYIVDNGNGSNTIYTENRNGTYTVSTTPEYKQLAKELLSTMYLIQSDYYNSSVEKIENELAEQHATEATAINADNAEEQIRNMDTHSSNISDNDRAAMLETVNQLLEEADNVILHNGDEGKPAIVEGAIVVSEYDAANFSAQEIIRQAAAKDLYSNLPTNVKIRQSLIAMLKIYQKLHPEGTMEEMLTAVIMNNDNIVFTMLVDNDQDTFNFIKNLPIVMDEIVDNNNVLSDIAKAIYKQKYKDMRTNIAIALMQYLKINTDANPNIEILSDAQTEEVNKQKLVQNQVQNLLKGVATDGTKKLYTTMINALPVDFNISGIRITEDLKNKWKDAINRCDVSRYNVPNEDLNMYKDIVDVTSEYYSYDESRKYNDRIYLKLTDIASSTFNDFLMSNNLTIRDTITTDFSNESTSIESMYKNAQKGVVDNDLRNEIILTYENDEDFRQIVDKNLVVKDRYDALKNSDSIFDYEDTENKPNLAPILRQYLQYKFEQYSKGAYSFKIQAYDNVFKITVNENDMSIWNKSGMISIEDISDNWINGNETGYDTRTDYRLSGTSKYVTEFTSRYVANDIPTTLKPYVTLNDLIKNSELLDSKVKQDISTEYGKVNNYTTYLYLVSEINELNKTRDVHYIIALTKQGEYVLCDATLSFNMLSDTLKTNANSKFTQKSVPISYFINEKYLTGNLRNVYVKFNYKAKNEQYMFDENDNTIYVATTQASLDLSNVRFQNNLLHEFSHVIQYENNLDDGSDLLHTFVDINNDSKSRDEFHMLVADVIIHNYDYYETKYPMIFNGKRKNINTMYRYLTNIFNGQAIDYIQQQDLLSNVEFAIYTAINGEENAEAFTTDNIKTIASVITNFENGNITVIMPWGTRYTFKMSNNAGISNLNSTLDTSSYLTFPSTEDVNNDVSVANRPTAHKYHSLSSIDFKPVTTSNGAEWQPTGRYVTIHDAMNTNLKYYLYKDGVVSDNTIKRDKDGKTLVVQMDPRLQRFIVAADLSKIDTDLRDLIVQGRLRFSQDTKDTQYSIIRYVHDTKSINKYTWDLLKQTIFPDCKVKDFETLKTYTDNADIYYGTLVILKYELDADLKDTYLDLGNGYKKGVRIANMDKTFNAINANQKFRDTLGLHVNSFMKNHGIDISENYSEGDMRMLIINYFDGTANSLFKALCIGKWAMEHNFTSAQSPKKSLSLERTHQANTAKNDSEGSLADTIADENTRYLEDELVDDADTTDIDTMIRDIAVTHWTKRTTEGKYSDDKTAKKALSKLISKYTNALKSGELTETQLRNYYMGAKFKEMQMVYMDVADKIISGEIKVVSETKTENTIYVRTDKNIKDNIRRTINKSIAPRITSNMIDYFTEHFPDIKFVSTTDEKTGIVTYKMDTSVIAGKSTEQLKALENEVKLAAQYAKFEANASSMAKKEYNRLKNRIEKQATQITKLQEQLNEQASTKTETFKSSNEFNYEFTIASNVTMPNSLHNILTAQFASVKMSDRDVQHISNNDDKQVKVIAENLFDDIALEVSQLNENDIAEIIDYYASSIVLNVNLNEQSGKDATKRFYCTEVAVLTYLLEQSQRNHIHLTQEQETSVRNTLESIVNVFGSGLSLWRESLKKLNFTKRITKVVAHRAGIDISEEAIDNLSMALDLNVGESYNGAYYNNIFGDDFIKGSGLSTDVSDVSDTTMKNIISQRIDEEISKLDKNGYVDDAFEIARLRQLKSDLDTMDRATLEKYYKMYSGIDTSSVILTAEVKQKLINKAIENIRQEVLKGYDTQKKAKKNDIWNRLVDWERMAMLSSPGTWIRNAISNEGVKWTNRASGTLGKALSKTFLRKTTIKNEKLTFANNVDAINAVNTEIEELRTEIAECNRFLDKTKESENNQVAKELRDQRKETRERLKELKEKYKVAKDKKSELMSGKQYQIVGTKVDANTATKVNELFKGTFYTWTDEKGKTHNVSFYDSIADGLSRYSDRTYEPIREMGRKNSTVETDSIVELITNNFTAKVINDNRFTSDTNNKLLKKVHGAENVANKILFRILSDDTWIKDRTEELFGKMVTELQLDTDNLMSRASLQVFADAYVYAAWEYMHRTNFWTKAEQYIHEHSSSMYFFYKQLLPFVSASWNWFVESLNYTPIGLAKGVHQLLNMEKTINKMTEQKTYGGEAVSAKFALYTAYKTTGKGIIGTIMMGIGALLAGFGVMAIDEDDDDQTIKLHFGDNVYIDVTSLFGTSGFLLGATTVSGIIDAIENGASISRVWSIAEQMSTSLLNDSILNSIFQSMAYSDSIGEWFLDQMVDSVSKFVPNIWKTVSSISNAGVVTKYESSVVGSLEYIALQIVPGLAYALPKKYDIWTGELEQEYKLPYLFTFLNKMLPVDIDVYDYSETEKIAKSLGLSKSYLTGNYDDIGQLTTTQLQYLNEMYGKLNASDLNDFINGKTKYKVQQENGMYVTLSYSQMTDKQKKSVINRIMTNNASYAKVYVYTTYMGGKYYATDSMYETLRKLGIRTNVYKQTSKYSGFN